MDDGIVVLVGDPKGAVLGPIGHLARMKLGAPLTRKRPILAFTPMAGCRAPIRRERLPSRG